MASSAALDLAITSRMQGMAIKLPAPLNKPAADVALLSYQGKLGNGKQLARLSVDGIASAGLHWRDKQLKRVLVRVGLPGVAWSEQAGISVEAAVDRLQLMGWRDFMSNSPSRLVSTQMGQALPRFARLSVQTKTLMAGDESLGAVVFSLVRDNNDWLLNADRLQPAALPKWPATRLSARITPQASGFVLDPLSLTQPSADFTGKLSWRTGARANTQLSGQIDTRATASLLTQLGLTGGLESRKGQMTFDLSWPGDPMRIELAQIDGTLAARFENGRLVNIDRINPLARVFGLVNASNLMRRLRFDFSDVTRKGLSFDELSVSGDLKRGVLSPANIDLDGPSVSLRGRGTVNMLTREVDQRLRVDIPVSSAAAVAGFLAGPVVGGALVAADLLLDKQLARLTSVRYRLTGPWDDLRVDDEALVKPDASKQDRQE